MEVIILQHIKIEDPGYIKDLMLSENCNLTTIELDEGEKIPENLNKFDAMFCMGSQGHSLELIYILARTPIA